MGSIDQDIGAASNLIGGRDSGLIVVTVGISSFPGIGEKTVAIAWDALEVSDNPRGNGYEVRVNADRESLSQAVENEAE